MKHLQQNRTGGTLISIVVALILLSILGATMAAMIHRGWNSHTLAYDIMRARYLAESGIDYALSTGDLEMLTQSTVTSPVTVAMGTNEQFAVTVTLQTNNTYRIRSVGSIRETHRVQMRGSLQVSDPDAPPDVSLSTVDSVVDDFTDLDYWDFVNKAFKQENGMISTQLDSNGNNFQDKEGKDWILNQIADFTHDNIEAAWVANSYQLSYEVQIKMSWDKGREYGAQGLAVMLEDQNAKNKNEGYHVSLMRYKNQNDGIPNSIKPSGKENKCLLVVWKQEMPSSKPVRTWIAYKDLTNEGDWVAEVTSTSGQGFADFVTLNVRVIEARVSDTKYHYLQVMRADPYDNKTRFGNEIAEDINENRLAYPQGSDGFPQWSPLDFDNWQSTNDYFSLSRSSIPWDGVNTNGQTKIMILKDNGTIRTEDFPTPDSGNLSGDRYEIGLHVTGDFEDASDKMYFDEFALRFLINEASSGGSSGGVSYYGD